MTEPADKAGWRAWSRRRRAALTPEAVTTAAVALAGHLLPRLAAARTVAAYVPVAAEPGSVDLLDGLRERGIAILLPVVESDGELEWAAYDGRSALAGGPLGLRQPVGERLGPGALAAADVVLAPALAVDHAGTRLGRGAGYYDAALARLTRAVPVVALLHDGELVPRLPADRWDHPVTAAVTPGLGWTGLPLVAHHGR